MSFLYEAVLIYSHSSTKQLRGPRQCPSSMKLFLYHAMRYTLIIYSITSKSTSRLNSTQVFLILLFTPPSPTHRDAFRCNFKLYIKFQTFGE